VTTPVEVVADHTLLLALPAFAPAVVVVAVVVFVAMRDRRDKAEESNEESNEAAQRENEAASDHDGSP
jgi:cytochrome c-type biogenesis protein CcmH/NrfF